MDKRRLISIAIAILVAVLIMNLGKSCTEDIVEANKKAKKETTTVYYNYAPNDGNGNGTPVIDETVPVIEEATEHVEYITSILGEIIGTVAPSESTGEEPTLPDEELPETTTRQSILNNPDPVEPATSPYNILGNEGTPQEATEGYGEIVPPTESPNQQQATVAKDFVIKLE